MTNPDSPVGPTDVIDVIGVRKDGGIDTVIACHGPLDSSASTLHCLEIKIRNYLREVASDDFVQECGSGPVRIFVACEHSVSDECATLIGKLAHEAAQQRVDLLLGSPVA